MAQEVDLNTYSEVTRQYSRFSRNAAGMGNVIGGILALAAWWIWAHMQDSVTRRTALIAIPIIWIAAREWLRHRYYQRYGKVARLGDHTEMRWRIALTSLTALVCAIILGFSGYFAIARPYSGHPAVPVIWLIIIAGMPFAVWFFFNGAVELILGVSLLSYAAEGVAGMMPHGSADSTVIFFALLLILFGIREHRLYRNLQKKLESIEDLP
jgi:hypothetical protein